MGRRWLLMAVLVLQGACTTVRPIQLAPPDEAGREVLQASTDRWTQVHLADTVFLARTGVRLYDDVLSWDSPAGVSRTESLDRVVALEHRDPVGGLLEGGLGGLAVAGVVGVTTHLFVDTEQYDYVPAGLAAGVVTGVVTVPVGALIGLLRGHRSRYDAR